MAHQRKIRWTAAQREIYKYLKQGLRVSEVQAKGHGRSNIERVNREVKAGNGPPAVEEVITTVTTPADTSKTKVQERVLKMVEVGGIFIEPQDWKINQYGGFMIMNTHSFAKQKYGYTGTVGEFICDACQVMRMVMGMDLMRDDYLITEEGENDDGQQEKGSEGESIHIETTTRGEEPINAS